MRLGFLRTYHDRYLPWAKVWAKRKTTNSDPTAKIVFDYLFSDMNGRDIDREGAVALAGGHLGMLHLYYPAYRQREWRPIGLIAVVTGACRATRLFSIFQRL
jgi:hypothetical protein